MGRLTVRCGKNIPRRPVLWMWPGRIPKNKVTLIQGDGGEGKSSFSLFFGAGMSYYTQIKYRRSKIDMV